MRGSLISQQVRILLERMDMYPEEFINDNLLLGVYSIQAKWQRILNEGTFTRIEKILIKRKYIALKRAATLNAIMETILEGDAPKEELGQAFSTTSRFDQALQNKKIIVNKEMLKAMQGLDK